MTGTGEAGEAAGPAEAILAVLRRTGGRALPAPELLARVRRPGGDGARTDGWDRARADGGLAELEAAGRVVVLDPPPPDVHLRGMDLRVVAAVDGPSPQAQERARRAADERWRLFLRDFLATHRCG